MSNATDFTNAKQEVAHLRDEKARLERDNERLKQKIQQLLRKLYGRSSEKINCAELLPEMRQLFLPEELVELEKTPGFDAAEVEPPVPDRPKRAERKEARSLPADLRVEETRIELPEEARTCPGCERPMEEIGTEETRKLAVIPAQRYVRKIIRPKYACRHCHGGGVLCAPLPPQALPKCHADESLLAHVVVQKFCDHIPLYRQSAMFARQGIDISDHTLCDWVAGSADVLAPIPLEMHRENLASGYIQSDDTSIRVLAKGGCDEGRLWIYGRYEGEVVFRFRMDRKREGPTEALKDYRGFLQSDAYAGYDEVVRHERLVSVGCWAHCRRKFDESRATAEARSLGVLGFIQRLYRVEATAREQGLAPHERRELRQMQSKPILEGLKARLLKLKEESLPASPIGEAITYALNQWQPLTQYVQHGELEIDNNSCERALRGVAVGRKNYLFLGSEAGGHRAAVLYSLIESCKRLGINPFEYLVDVLRRIASCGAGEIASLTPRNWQASRAGHAAI